MPLGLLSLASYCQDDFDVKLFDFGGTTEEELLNHSALNSFDAICITLTSISYYIVKKLVRKLRENNDSVLIILGGAHPSALPLETIQEIECDIIVVGEGEIILHRILKAFEGNPKNASFFEYLKNFDCLYFRSADGISVGTHSYVLDDLDRMPKIDYSLLDIDRYTNLSLLTSRGCNGKCIFCAGALIGGVYRRRNLSNIFHELKEGIALKKDGTLFVVDNNFMGESHYVEHLLQKIKEEKIERIFSCESRIGDFDDTLFKTMHSLGFRGIQFGIESGSNKILKKVGKGVTRKDVLDVVEKTVNIGFMVAASFIIGHPYETREDVRETVGLIKDLKSMGVQVAVGGLVPYPGTPVFKLRDQLEIKIHSYNWEDYYEYHPVISTRYFSREELAEILFGIITETIMDYEGAGGNR